MVLPSSSQGFGFVFWTYISLEIDHKNLNTQRFSKEPQERSIAKVRGRLWPLKGTVSSPELWQFLAFRNDVGVKCRQLTPIIWKCLSLIPGQCRSSIKLIFPGLKFEFFRILQWYRDKCGPLSLFSLKCASNGYPGSVKDLQGCYFPSQIWAIWVLPKWLSRVRAYFRG